MHGCASPSVFCSVFIWRGGFAPSLCCNGTVFLVYLKCFVTVVLEEGQFWQIVCVMTWGRHAFVCRWSLWNCFDLPNAFERRQHKLFGYVSHIDCKCMPMQCHRCNHICTVISTKSLSRTTTIVWSWTSMEMYHIWLKPLVRADEHPFSCGSSSTCKQISNPSTCVFWPRNEARRIRETILSVMDAADMAVILDTGSSDGTQNIIKQATWQNSAFPTFLKPFFFLTASI